MFSPRFVAVWGFALLAAASAFPASERAIIPPPITTISDDDFGFPWMSISPFSLFAPLWRLIPSFADIGPRIYSDEDKFQVVVNVRDYKKQDLKVKVKGDLIFVQGSQEANNNNRDVFTTQFFHTYSLPSNSSSADVTAELTSDGFLIVTAPISKDIDKSKEADRDVTIVETGKPYTRDVVAKPAAAATTEAVTTDLAVAQEQSTQTSPTTQASTTAVPELPITNPAPTPTQTPVNEPSPTASSTAEVEKEVKDITTPIEPEEATEKDNVIPHGNDVAP